MKDNVTLSHGAGGADTRDLIETIFAKRFANPDLTGDDAAVLNLGGTKLAFSTDGFIVSPYRFPGGNVGKLSICGTVNDIACMGARPEYLTCAFVIEEGFPVEHLNEIAEAMAATAAKAGIRIVAGDTKVAGKGQVDGIFITTTGIGRLIDGATPAGNRARPGDAVIVSGDVGRHGCTILLARENFGIEAADVTSDCAPLAAQAIGLSEKIREDLHVVRDATRGGVGTVLHEIAEQSGVGIRIEREDIPVHPQVQGVCGMLGLDPLFLACEGRLVVFVPKGRVEEALAILHALPDSANACVIGEVTEEVPAGNVTVRTALGTETLLPEPGGELLPRIC